MWSSGLIGSMSGEREERYEGEKKQSKRERERERDITQLAILRY